MVQLYVGNLAPEVDEQLLFELMLQLSPVVSVQMPKAKTNHKHQGYGFATFASEADAEYVFSLLQETQLRLFGRPVKVNRAQRSTNTQATDLIPQRLFVGNLDPDLVTEEALALPFGRFGRVLGVELVRDKSGNPKGYAFVSLPSGAAHEAVVKMNGQYLMNRICKVEFERSH